MRFASETCSTYIEIPCVQVVVDVGYQVRRPATTTPKPDQIKDAIG